MKKPEQPRHLHVKKGDQVVVLSGRDRGATGEVIAAFPRAGKVTVDGINMVTRHQRPRRDNPFAQLQQGVIQKPAPLHAAKVLVLCPGCQRGTRPRSVVGADGRRSRACRKCGHTID